MADVDATLFLPEPEPREVLATIISVDDHLVEPADMFDGRLPAAPRRTGRRGSSSTSGVTRCGSSTGSVTRRSGMNAVVGRRPETVKVEPFRFDQMRKGCWDIDARVHDMDLNGVWASLSFPSMITGFCGRVYSQCSDPELGLATTRAFNDWVHDAWWQPHPDRVIPLGITWLSDPELGADEIHRNAERGFRAVTLPERPHLIGYPSIFDDYWEPILRACADTDTVVCLHVGLVRARRLPAGVRPGDHAARRHAVRAAVAPGVHRVALVGLAGAPAALKIAMAEGGIGWVAMLLDRLDNIVDRSGYGLGWDERPADVLRRNFWFCTIDDPSTIDTRHAIGVENIMVEVDYPHGDCTWPDTQAVIEEAWGHLPAAERRAMCSENAASLFRHPLPDVVLPALS